MIDLIEHIVKYNEGVNDILNMYHIELDELIKHNSHITDFNRLLSGSKILIPNISKEVEQILDKTEVFVADYYPKISEELIPKIDDASNTKPQIEEKENIIIKPENRDIKVNVRGAYPGILPPKKPYRGRL